MKFQVIIADPPFKFSDKLQQSDTKRGAESQYQVMSINELCNLPIKEISDPDGCILCLWVPGSMLEDGLKIMKTWGFEQKQVFVWVKTKKDKSILRLITKIIPKQGWGSGINFLINNISAFGLGRLFRQTHEICLVGINNTKIYNKLEDRSQRSVCFSENKGHSIKPDNLHESLEKMFPAANKIELFARRQRNGWYSIGNECPDTKGEDILVSINKLI
jgi:N6-adenosine-specific RNA methylase IME4